MISRFLPSCSATVSHELSPGAVDGDFDGAVEHAVDGGAFAQGGERVLIDRAVDADAVLARPAGGRKFEDAGEATVVGEDQETLGVDVEPADGDDARQVAGQRVEDGGAAFGVVVGGDEALGLVEEPGAGPQPARDFLAVHFDLVVVGDDGGGRVELAAVEADAAVLDQRLGLAAGGDAGARHHLGDALALGAFFARLGLLRRGIALQRRGGGGFVVVVVPVVSVFVFVFVFVVIVPVVIVPVVRVIVVLGRLGLGLVGAGGGLPGRVGRVVVFRRFRRAESDRGFAVRLVGSHVVHRLGGGGEDHGFVARGRRLFGGVCGIR